MYARGGATTMPAVQLAMDPPGWCAEVVVGEAPQFLPQPKLWPDGALITSEDKASARADACAMYERLVRDGL